jgi:hypothetical protein
MNLPHVFSFNCEQNKVLGWDNFCASGICPSLHNTPDIEGSVARARMMGGILLSSMQMAVQHLW